MSDALTNLITVLKDQQTSFAIALIVAVVSTIFSVLVTAFIRRRHVSSRLQLDLEDKSDKVLELLAEVESLTDVYPSDGTSKAAQVLQLKRIRYRMNDALTGMLRMHFVLYVLPAFADPLDRETTKRLRKRVWAQIKRLFGLIVKVNSVIKTL